MRCARGGEGSMRDWPGWPTEDFKKCAVEFGRSKGYFVALRTSVVLCDSF